MNINRRLWATVGLSYMIIIMAINFYALSTGNLLHNLTPLLICPVVCGLLISVAFRLRAGTMDAVRGVVSVVLCSAALILCLWSGIPLLLSNFR